MARRRRIASAVDTSKRSCPVCTLKRIHAIFQQRLTIKNRRTDQSTCVCLECGAAWNESYMVRAQEIHTSNVQTREQQIAARPIDRTASKIAVLAEEDSMSRLCPVCESDQTSAGFNGSHVGHAGREDRATASCHECGALWHEVFYRRTGETVNSNIRPGGLKAAIEADKANAARRHAPNQGDGCPVCGGVHIGVKPHGNAAASCTCIDCGAAWDHRHEHGNVYRSNIKEAANV